MNLCRPSDERTFPVCLRQVRPDVRLAALGGIKVEGDGEDLLEAALNPSATVYYLRPSAAAILEEVAA